MQQAALDHVATIDDVELLHNPLMCKVNKAIAKGALTLPCCSTRVSDVAKAKKCTGKELLANVECPTGEHMTFSIQSVTVQPLTEKNELNESAFVVPAMFVSKAGIAEDANMMLENKAYNINGYVCHVPVLVSSRKISKGSVLSYTVKQAGPASKKAKA